MAKSELIDEIRKQYLQAHPDVAAESVDRFCVFMTDWLCQKGIQGVGMQATGLALRFADGSQLGLIAANAPYTTDTPAIGINAVQREDPRRILGDSPSFSITGR